MTTRQSTLAGLLAVIAVTLGPSLIVRGSPRPSLPPCPWDCADFDGVVAVPDLLALLSQWGLPGSCDFDGGVVAVPDLLKLLANWGVCPP